MTAHIKFGTMSLCRCASSQFAPEQLEVAQIALAYPHPAGGLFCTYETYETAERVCNVLNATIGKQHDGLLRRFRPVHGDCDQDETRQPVAPLLQGGKS